MNSSTSYEQIHSSVASTNAVILCIQTAQVHFNMDKPMSYYREWYHYVKLDGEQQRMKIIILYSPPMNGVEGQW